MHQNHTSLVERVRTVRTLFAAGHTTREIAEMTGLHPGWVADIATHDVYGGPDRGPGDDDHDDTPEAA